MVTPHLNRKRDKRMSRQAKAKGKGLAFRPYLRWSENIGTRWNDLKRQASVWVKLTNSPPGQRGKGVTDGKGWSVPFFSTRWHKGEELSSGWKRALKAPTAIISRRYIANVLSLPPASLFLLESPADSKIPMYPRYKDSQTNEIVRERKRASCICITRGYDWIKRPEHREAENAKANSLYHKYEFAIA